jgi:hypothetical protein
VRPAVTQARKRNDLLWYGAGFLLVQLGLAVGVERFWPAVRDPDFDDLQRIVRDQAAAAPGRPLALAIGSSRTLMALRPDRLNLSSDPATPCLINAGVAGGGPMLYQVALRRFLAAGLRPNQVYLEIMPVILSARRGSPFEERQLTERYSAAEVARLWPYYAEPARLAGPWLLARVLPCYRHAVELRLAMGIDLPVGGLPRRRSGRDDLGWRPCPQAVTAVEVEVMTREALEEYEPILTQPAVAPGALRAYRDVIRLCLDEHIPVVLVVPPEGSAFRNFAPAVAAAHLAAVRDLARELAVPLIDARTWVDDRCFIDGHHATREGTEQYTERFGCEVLQRYPVASLSGGR